MTKRNNTGAMGAKAMRLVCAAVLAFGMAPAAAFAETGAPQGASPAGGEAAGGAEGNYASGEIIVVLDAELEGRSLAGANERLSSCGLRPVEQLSALGSDGECAFVARVEEGVSVEDAVAAAEDVYGVAYAQPNFIYRLPEDMAAAAAGEAVAAGDADAAVALPADTAIDDPKAPSEYYLKSWENGYGVDAYGAWDTARAEHSVTIAVLDTGIRVDHEDLAANILTEYMCDMYLDTAPGVITSDAVVSGDNCGHGTHVAGIAAASANNAVGIAGASYNANILPIKVFSNESSEPACRTSDLVQAYEYLLDLVSQGKVTDLHVVNMSLGGYGAPNETDRLLEQKIEQAANTYDIMTVAAGGNGDIWGNPLTQNSYPSDYEAVVSVTATDQLGCNISWSDYNAEKDISAPGGTMYSTFNSSNRSYAYLSGTSMASPLVAGVAALLWAECPTLTVDEAKTALYSTANPLSPQSENYRPPEETGSCGVVDARDAVLYVQEHYSGANRLAMSACSVEPIADQLYTGLPVEPSQIVVKDGEKVLAQGVDYALSFRNNVEAGTASVTVAGMGEYVGYTSATFSIRYDLTQGVVVPSAESFDYTGEAITPSFKVVCRGRLLSAGVDYTALYLNNVGVGTATIRVEGLGSYMGVLEGTFAIKADANHLAGATIEPIADATFTGAALEPECTVVAVNGAKLVRGVDYELSYRDNVHAGTATVTASGKGAYTGSCEANFAIVPAPIDSADVSVAGDIVVGDDPAAAGIRVSLGGAELACGTDYDISYASYGKPGYGVATIRGMGDVEGERDVRFRVVTAEPFSFADVAPDDWFAPWTAQASSLGIVNGHQDDNGQLTGMFGPNEPLTRAQAAIMLARAAGVDLPTGPVVSNGAFEDNLDGRYYTAAINWASEAGILRGDDPDRTKVRPTAPVSRAELAVMMARFAAFFSVDTSAASPDAFYQCLDYRDVPDWAAPAMMWTAANGIITGYPAPGGSELRCYDTVTRAQMAKVTVRSAETVFGIPALSQ